MKLIQVKFLFKGGAVHAKDNIAVAIGLSRLNCECLNSASFENWLERISRLFKDPDRAVSRWTAAGIGSSGLRSEFLPASSIQIKGFDASCKCGQAQVRSGRCFAFIRVGLEFGCDKSDESLSILRANRF